METTAITPGWSTPLTEKQPGFEGLDSDDFLKLLVAQLSYQDPLEPTSNEEIVNQISSIRDIEASTTLTRTLESLADNQGFGSAAALIGQYVSGTTTANDGSTVSSSGIVVGLRIDSDGTIVLLLDTDEEIKLSNVKHVTTARQFAEALMGRMVSGLDRSDPQNPTLVEGLVTGVANDTDGQVVLELDNGSKLRLTDVSATSTLTDDNKGTV